MERKFGRYAVPHVTIALISIQVVVFVISLTNRELLNAFALIPRRVLEGEVWRLLSFLAIPPLMNPIFVFFYFYLFYLMGEALEDYWGTFRYNIFLLLGYVATVAFSFLVPDAAASNWYFYTSIYLAFALLFPDFLLYILFVLPVKIKWLALIIWISYGYQLITGDRITRLLVVAATLNLLVFFGKDLLYRIRTGRRQMEFQAKSWSRQSDKQPFHRCTVCGITDLTHPDMDFRYCMECKGSRGYCTEHIFQHPHILTDELEQKAGS